METGSKWIVARQEEGHLVGFVRLSGKCVVVTHEPYKNAKVFSSANNAKGLAWELNTMKYSAGTWKAIEI